MNYGKAWLGVVRSHVMHDLGHPIMHQNPCKDQTPELIPWIAPNDQLGLRPTCTLLGSCVPRLHQLGLHAQHEPASLCRLWAPCAACLWVQVTSLWAPKLLSCLILCTPNLLHCISSIWTPFGLNMISLDSVSHHRLHDDFFMDQILR